MSHQVQHAFRPGDDTNVILRKILSMLIDGIAVTETSPVAGTVTVAPAAGTLTDGSGSITTGGVSQQIFAANSTRKYLLVQNLSTENMWVNFGSAAAADSTSVKLLPNGSVVMESSFVSNQTVNVIAATTGSKFVAKQG